MNILLNDDAITYEKIFHKHHEDWNMLVRADGSISVYGTQPSGSYHRVIFDTLDKKSPSDYALKIIVQIKTEAVKAQRFANAFFLLEKEILTPSDEKD